MPSSQNLIKAIFNARNKKQDKELASTGKTTSSVPEFVNRRRQQREDSMKALLEEDK
jgi:hypothetical protein